MPQENEKRKEIKKEITEKEKVIKRLNKKKKLSPTEQSMINTYQKRIGELNAELNAEMMAGGNTSNSTSTKGNTNKGNQNTPNNQNTPSNKNTPNTSSSTETALSNSEQKAQKAADAMNEGNEKKVDDVGSATKTAKEMANTVDANIEENVPTWFWREAREMAPTDKAKRGFIISNYITNRLGTALGNIGAIVQNNGGSGGGQIKEQGGSYIDQYRQGKLEQALTNRKKKQDSLMQAQNDILTAVLDNENEVRAIQNKLRNSGHYNNFNRLTNEQQVYIKGLLYSDTQGRVDDAMLGELIARMMDGKNVSLEDVASTVLTAAGMKNSKQMITGASNILNKAIQLGEKAGSWFGGVGKLYKKPGE